MRLQRAHWLALICLAIIGPSDAKAYRTLADDPEIDSSAPVVWESSRIVLHVSRASLTAPQRQALSDAVATAAARWNAASCAEIDFVSGSSTGFAEPSDGNNTVEWVATGWSLRGFPAGVAATTDVRIQRAEGGIWSIAEADVYVNGDDYDWDLFGGSGVAIVPALVHELGHVLGLLHPCESGGEDGAPVCTGEQEHVFRLSVLYPDHQENGGLLTDDDVEGACDLYPTHGCAGDLCGPGEVCVDGACVSSAGQSCLYSSCQSCELDSDCSAGEFCKQERCAPQTERGGACLYDAECLTGLCVEGFCTSSCEVATDCPTSNVCSEGGWCRPNSRSRESCSMGDDCASGLCLSSDAVGSMCTNRCRAYTDCFVGEQCSPVDGALVCRRNASSVHCAVTAVSRSARPPNPWLHVVGIALAIWFGRRRWFRSGRSSRGRGVWL